MPSHLGMNSILGSSLTRWRRASPRMRSIRQEEYGQSSMTQGAGDEWERIFVSSMMR